MRLLNWSVERAIALQTLTETAYLATDETRTEHGLIGREKAAVCRV
jgi:hypothetical protein